jgi:hypothetical protein
MAAPSETRPAAGNRKEFVRTQVPLAERVASGVIVALLIGLGVVIAWQGRRFDPTRYALRADALKSTAENVEGKTGTIRGEAAASRGVVKTATAIQVGPAVPAAEGYEFTEAPVAAKAVAKGEPLEVKLSGLTPMSDTEFYSADNLYEKIDGRAPAYLNFNFQQLRCRSFSVTAAAGSFVDVYEYRFDKPINAFGMFALERDAKGRGIDFAPDGYAGELGFYFRQGPVYVQVIASDQKAPTLALARAIAEDRARLLPADNAGLDARRRLPVTGLDPTSVQFEADNALGQDFLKNVFQAQYAFDGAKLPFFVMVATPVEAAAAWRSFQEFSGKFGGKVTALPGTGGAKLFQAEGFGTWKVVFQRDGEVGGVFDAADGEKARQFVEQYLQGKIP